MIRLASSFLILIICALASFPCMADAPQKATLILEHEQRSAWTDLLFEGLRRGGDDFSMAVDVVIAPPGDKQADIFRKAAGDSSVVIVASDNLHEILRDNAANFRRVKFGCVDAGIRASNIMSVTFADEQAAFLAGAAAALLTRAHNTKGINGENIVGWLSGEDTPAMRSLFNGFEQGVKLVDPQTRVVQAITGSFTDLNAAREKAEKLLDTGADVIALAAGAGNAGAGDALAKRNAWSIDLDKASGMPHTLGVITKAADRAVYEILASAADKKFRGKEIVVYNLNNRGVDMKMSADARSAIPGGVAQEISRRLGELRHELEQGAIKLQSLRARTLCDCLD